MLEEAARTNAALGHENLGSVSVARGFVPLAAPLLELPASHRAWDDAARALPELYATLHLRAHLATLPQLDVDALPEECLQRAATVLGILVHAHLRVQPWEPVPAPPALEQAWTQVLRRLGRDRPFLAYGDIILANWRHGAAGRELTAEALELLVPTVGTPEERIFYLVQLEMHAVGAPIVDACAGATEAIDRADHTELIVQLDRVADTLTALIRRSLPKIDPNPYSKTHVDPVVWAKTVAPLAVPLRDGSLGPSGTASPLFHVLDALFGRRRYRSQLGTEALALRAGHPPHWRRFIAAVDAIGLPAYVAAARDRRLSVAYARAADLFTGQDGLLQRHRLKVLGFIETAFKLGRSVTIGGFSGTFAQRPWRLIDDALSASLHERIDETAGASVHRVPIVRAEPAGEGDRVYDIALGTAGLRLRAAAGDRCLVLPEQDDDLVRRTLRALQADGDESIGLDAAWQRALRAEGRAVDRLPVEELLRRGELRPLRREVAKVLLELSGAEPLEDVIERRAEDQLELPDALELLAAGGWAPSILLGGEPGETTSLCRVVAPVLPRVYSVSSDDGDELHLTVARLEYATRAPGNRVLRGAASHCLAAGAEGREVGLSVRRSPAFAPPEDPATPIVMVAGGSGIAPFRAFLQQRAGARATGERRLLLGVRDRGELFYRSELERMIASIGLHVTVAFSREDCELQVGDRRLVVVPGRRRSLSERIVERDVAAELWRLVRDRSEGGAGAVVFVCGAAGFAASIADAFRRIFEAHGDSPADARLRLRLLLAERRYVEEVFTTYTRPHETVAQLIDASELVQHASDTAHPWLAIAGRVYDMTEFREQHPGGDVLIDAHAGTDATEAFRFVGHHAHADVAARLSLYEIGAVRRLRLGRSWSVFVGERGLELVTLADLYREWIRLLYATVELHNTVLTDASVRARRTTRDRAAGELIAYTTQFCIEAHDRFLLNFGELIGAPLARLWAMYAGMSGERCDVRQLPRALATVRDGDAARAARATTRPLYAALQRCADTRNAGELRDLDRRCAAVLDADRRLSARFASALRDGLRVFELHEASAIEHGGADLRSALLSTVALLADHAREVNEAVARAARDS